MSKRSKRSTNCCLKSDVVTLHVPEAADTREMIGERQIRTMKRGSYFINNARGSVVDLDALAAALKDRHLAGAAVDVFPIEPSANSEKFINPLQGLDNVVLTPHVGGSTEEAQERIGTEVARKFVDYLDNGSTLGAVNFPQVIMPRKPPRHSLSSYSQQRTGRARPYQRGFFPAAAQYSRTVLRD